MKARLGMAVAPEELSASESQTALRSCLYTNIIQKQYSISNYSNIISALFFAWVAAADEF